MVYLIKLVLLSGHQAYLNQQMVHLYIKLIQLVVKPSQLLQILNVTKAIKNLAILALMNVKIILYHHAQPVQIVAVALMVNTK